MDQRVLNRFMQKIEKTDDCWLWTGGKNYKGYGVFNVIIDGHFKARTAHRISYEHHHNTIPTGLVVRHKCRSKHCVNPEHLEVGTQHENILDKIRDGTHGHKLTDEKIRDIRSRVGQTQQKIAEEFKITQPMVHYIRRGKTWKHLS